MGSKGHAYVASASCPTPLFFRLFCEYEIPVTDGPRGYTDKHGQFRPI